MAETESQNIAMIKDGFSLTIPLITGGERAIKLPVNETLFLLGANGSGKSSLMHKFLQDNKEKAYRIAANREICFDKNTVYSDRENEYNPNWEYQNAHEARWNNVGNNIYHPRSRGRRDFTITQLLNKENYRNKMIANAEAYYLDYEEAQTEYPSTIAAINMLLDNVRIPIKIDVNQKTELIATRIDDNNDEEYSFAELSDGERAAILIAADILHAESHKLFLIDEPERHLHRSISALLLKALFAQRPDCAFVISTHDIALVQAIENSKILLLRDCRYENKQAVEWVADLIDKPEEIPESLQTAILGARRNLLFVEGKDASLDRPLYRLLFPGYEIISRKGCSAVIGAVKGTHSLEQQHRLTIFGIIDNDGRTPEQQKDLMQNNIYVLPVYTIESLYYASLILREMAERQQNHLCELKAEELLEEANKKAELLAEENIESMAALKILHALTEEFKTKKPKPKELYDKQKLHIWRESVTEFIESVPNRLAEEKVRLRNCINTHNIAAIIENYPIKSLIAAFSRSLLFPSDKTYESAVRRYLENNPKAIEALREKYFKPLIEAMEQKAKS